MPEVLAPVAFIIDYMSIYMCIFFFFESERKSHAWERLPVMSAYEG